MNKYLLTACFLLAVLPGYGQTGNQIKKKVRDIVQRMSLVEKVGQMAQITLDTNVLEDAIVHYKIGSVLNTTGDRGWPREKWNRYIGIMQTYTGKTRLKIPIIYGLDDIHGANFVLGATLFPQETGQAAACDPELTKEAAAVTAYEARSANIPWAFSPVMDLGVNPVWPRIWEGYGEDPYLSATLGSAAVHGFQDPIGSKFKVVVSLKHYLGYSDPKSGKDRTDAWIPENYLREYHLPPFAAAIKAGAGTVMVNSALINGIPTHINHHLLTDILKGELRFSGFVVTDWQDIQKVYLRDHVAKDEKDAIRLVINAGVDMAMIPTDYKSFCDNLIALVREHKVAISRIDDAVSRILKVKMELKLWDQHNTDYPEFSCDSFQKIAYRLAAESMVLLKNQHQTLPLKAGTKILVTGPNANSMRTLDGGWSYSWQGDAAPLFTKQYHTILDAVKLHFTHVTYVPAVAYINQEHDYTDQIQDIDAAVNAAKDADVILLCIGENSYTETPGNISDLLLSPNQAVLAKALEATGKPVILILNEGRPRIIRDIEPGAAAIIDIFLPGNYGGDALASILAGTVNPSGKMPVTYPKEPNALTNYIHKPSDNEFDPQYEFGYGLSYTRFDYSPVAANKHVFNRTETAHISVIVKNGGLVAGQEVVELFSSQDQASISPDVKRLRRFQKIFLQPGETKTTRFDLPLSELAYINAKDSKELDAGKYSLYIAGQTLRLYIRP